MLTEDTIKTLIWAVVFVFAVQGIWTYCVLRLLVTGHGIMNRSKSELDDKRLLHWGTER